VKINNMLIFDNGKMQIYITINEIDGFPIPYYTWTWEKSDNEYQNILFEYLYMNDGLDFNLDNKCIFIEPKISLTDYEISILERLIKKEGKL
jgi:hypothetical protein